MEKLSQEDSMALITRMIATAKGNVGQGAFQILLWGWVTVIISLSHFLLIMFQVTEHPEFVWLLMIPTLVVSMVVGFKKGQKATVRTPLDYIYKWTWFGFMITFGIMYYFVFGTWELLSPIILLLAGYATFLSGKIIKFKPMVYGGVSLWIWALVAYWVGPYYALLITSIAITTGYIIPGTMLQRRRNEL